MKLSISKPRLNDCGKSEVNMNWVHLANKAPHQDTVVAVLFINDSGTHDVLPGFIRENQYVFPDGCPENTFKPVAWMLLPHLPPDCKYQWDK